jgi:predicted dehydrogenase
MEAQAQHFVDTLRSGKKPMGSVDEVLGVMEVLDAVYRSAEQGKEIKVG